MVERRVEGVRRGIEALSRHQTQNLVSSAGIQSAGLRSRRSHVRVVHEVPTKGVWQSGRLRLAVNQVLIGTVVRIHPHPPAGLAEPAEQRPPRARAPAKAHIAKRCDAAAKAGVRGSIPWSGASSSRRSQVAEGIWLQTRRRKPASARIGPSSPASSAQWTEPSASTRWVGRSTRSRGASSFPR